MEGLIINNVIVRLTNYLPINGFLLKAINHKNHDSFWWPIDLFVPNGKWYQNCSVKIAENLAAKDVFQVEYLCKWDQDRTVKTVRKALCSPILMLEQDPIMEISASWLLPSTKVFERGQGFCRTVVPCTLPSTGISTLQPTVKAKFFLKTKDNLRYLKTSRSMSLWILERYSAKKCLHLGSLFFACPRCLARTMWRAV